jgi:hypothetical protein
MDEALRETLARIERKLDVLIMALAEDDDDGPAFTLDGELIALDRDPAAPL